MQPRYYARFFHVPVYGAGAEYPFSTDFSSGEVLSAAIGKLPLIEAIDGAFAQVFPEQGRASVGNVSLVMTNVANLVLYYLSAATFTLGQAMTPTSPGAGETLLFSTAVLNIPAGGTLEISSGDPPVIERVRYTGLDAPAQQVTIVARGVDGTTAAAHAIDDPVVNGEQIRPGQRCQIYAGYAQLAEADYMPFMKMEVTGRRLHDSGEAFVIELSDIQLTLRREIFLTASEDVPITIVGVPLDLLLHVLLSTGTAVNGPYDDWPAAWGLGIPLAYVDVEAIQTVSALIGAPEFAFTIIAPTTGKDWIEKELLQPINCYPVVTQDGKYSIKQFGGTTAL